MTGIYLAVPKKKKKKSSLKEVEPYFKSMHIMILTMNISEIFLINDFVKHLECTKCINESYCI